MLPQGSRITKDWSDTLPLDPLLDWDPSPLDQDPLLLETLNDSLYDGNYNCDIIMVFTNHAWLRQNIPILGTIIWWKRERPPPLEITLLPMWVKLLILGTLCLPGRNGISHELCLWFNLLSCLLLFQKLLNVDCPLITQPKTYLRCYYSSQQTYDDSLKADNPWTQ